MLTPELITEIIVLATMVVPITKVEKNSLKQKGVSL